MSRAWIHEPSPRWDEHKQRIVGGAPAGAFDRRFTASRSGDPLPGEWWRVEDEGEVVGYGWLDVVWGDAEILLATAPEARGRGIGTFIVDRLEAEARERGVNYVYNTVRPTHPDRARVTAWLEQRGFTASSDGSLLRAVARPTSR